MSNNTAATLPDLFVCFFNGYERPRRYMRMGEDKWEVALWVGWWKFFDNIGDALAVEDFEDAGQKYQVILPEEMGE